MSDNVLDFDFDIDKIINEPVKQKENDVKTLLIFGISSFVGSNLAEFFKDEYRVIGTYHKTVVDIPGVISLRCDVSNKEACQIILSAFRPDITIYGIGLSSMQDCEENSKLAEALNTNGLFNVVELCQRYKSQVCYLSSCFVFNGANRNYIEIDIPDSNTVYGKSQAASEFYIQKSSLNYVIFRCCKFYGKGYSHRHPTWLEKIENAIVKNKNIKIDDKVKLGFMDIKYLGMILKIVFEKKVVNRLLQINSKDIMSHYEFAMQLCKTYHLNDSLINKSAWIFPESNAFGREQGEGDNRHFKLDIMNIESFLKVSLPSIRESIEFSYRNNKKKNIFKTKKSQSSSGGNIQFI